MADRTKKWHVVLVYGFVLTFFIGTAIIGSKAVTAMKDTQPIQGRLTLIIDPGHGGIDGGATSVSGVLESNINLDIAVRLRDLCNLLGFKTSMTRITDRSMHTVGDTIAAQKVSDLKNRVTQINNTKDAFLVSIHQNYFQDSIYKGAQVFFGSEKYSEELANKLQSEIIRTLNKCSERRVKKAKGIYLMQHITCPGVLVECGFISNPEEDELLQNESYQKKLCCVIASVFSSFWGNKPQT